MDLLQIVELADPELTAAVLAYSARHVPAFLQLARSHPLQVHRPGYVSLSEAFWLWRLAAELRPALVVESGTMDGYSAWWLRQGTDPARCHLHTYDPAGCPRINCGPNWNHTTRHDFPCAEIAVDLQDSPLTLAFFDDHQDQGARLDQAVAAGIRHVVFHDTYPGRRANPSLWERGVGRFSDCRVFQFPALTEPAVFRRPELAGHRWLTYCRVLG